MDGVTVGGLFMGKKAGIFLLSVAGVIVGFSQMPVKAVSPEKSGTWGTVSWNLSEDGTLEISGKGEIKDWDSGLNADAPSWTQYTMGDLDTKVTSIVFDEGITKIGANTFVLCSDATSIEFPSTLTEIGEGAFAYCEDIESIVIPDTVKKVDANAFVEAHSLKEIYVDRNATDIDVTAFESECEYQDADHDYKYLSYEKYEEDKSEAEDTENTENTEATENNGSSDNNSSDSATPSGENAGADSTAPSGGNNSSDSSTPSGGNNSSDSSTPSGENNSSDSNTPSGDNNSSDSSTPSGGNNSSDSSTPSGENNSSDSSTPSGENNSSDSSTPHTHVYETVVVPAAYEQRGSIKRICNACGDVESYEEIGAIKSVKLSRQFYTYNGKKNRPTVTVKDEYGSVISKNNYDLSYSNNKAIGIASVTITFKGNYTGQLVEKYTIGPKGVNIGRLFASSKGFSVSWKKGKNITGYEIQYSTDMKFKATKSKSMLVTNKNTLNKKITKITGNKRYYVRVRTYCKVKGKKIYSAWSSAKMVKTRK